MSCDWFPYCLTCRESYDMFNCHKPDFILYLIGNVETILKIGELQEGTGVDIEIHTWYGNLHPAWFKTHCGHQLVPRNEYGRYLDSNGKEIELYE